jgi:hypothetical protein
MVSEPFGRFRQGWILSHNINDNNDWIPSACVTICKTNCQPNNQVVLSFRITPEIVMYILVILAFFILFLCFCLFKEPDEKDYFSAHGKSGESKYLMII